MEGEELVVPTSVILSILVLEESVAHMENWEKPPLPYSACLDSKAWPSLWDWDQARVTHTKWVFGVLGAMYQEGKKWTT